MNDSNPKPWVDVLTMAIPRLTTQSCIGSMLDCWVDRDQYRVRWLVHLDQYVGLEEHWLENLEQINNLAGAFDAATICVSNVNRGFGPVVKHLMGLVEHHCLWMEDDWFWESPWSLREVDDTLADFYSFVTAKTEAGAMHPTFWRYKVIDFVRGNLPADMSHFQEKSMVKICRLGKFTFAHIPPPPCKHIGLDAMERLGFSHGWNGLPLRGHRKAPKFNRETSTWVKQ